MANDNKLKDPKKSFPTTFLLFLLGIVLLVVTVQNFMTAPHAKVAFSHEVEHLVNLNLILPEESRKVSLNDNLVTFSGRFREAETEEGKRRFKFLELLEQNHELTRERSEAYSELSALRAKVQEAGEWFLELSGQPLPAGGYRIVDPGYGGTDEAALVIQSVPSQGMVNLKELQGRYAQLRSAGADLRAFGQDLLTLITHFQSPILGIGSESMKQELKSLYKEVSEAQALPASDQLVLYKTVLSQLEGIETTLSEPVAGVRLSDLRSVRLYRDEMNHLAALSTQLEQNTIQLDKARAQVSQTIWFFNNQELSTRALEKQDAEAYAHWFATAKEEWENFRTNKGLGFKAPDQPRNLVLEKNFKSEEPAPNYLSYLITFLPVILVVLLLYFVFSRQMKGMGGGAMNFGKSPARLLQKGQNKVTFKDVAGIDEAKEELMEIVEFLKNPGKFTALGGRIPKGILCIGPPGTGKTLIAKAVAGEADRPFFSIAGSDFVEMFVGVGASRIRDMFAQAKQNAPCIIFIDEIDAVGRHRGAGIGGGHDEREQTLNQLLVEMDGFDTSEGVILMAATNRPDVLDKALLRPGRFDRRVVISLPDIKGRFEILKVHARKIKMDPSVDLLTIAKSTPGASGADLENLLNEAALLAARRGRTAVTALDTSEARDKVLYGKERRSLEMDEGEKRTTAYHEAGHAVVGLIVEKADPVDKVTIIPRGLSLGATHFLPQKNRLSYWKTELIDQLAVLMGGRCAEEIFVGDISSGAQQDFAQATRLTRTMLCEWGMDPELGVVAYDEKTENLGGYGGQYHERPYSEKTAVAIDAQVRKTLDEALERARQILLTHREEVEQMREALIEFETLSGEDVKKIMSHEWNAEEKRAKLKEMENLSKRTNVVPPPPPAPDLNKNDLGVVGT